MKRPGLSRCSTAIFTAPSQARDLQAALLLVMLLVFSASMAFAQRASKVGKAENKEMLERPAAEGLPIAAQSLISATIGRDQGAYRAVATRQGFRLKKLNNWSRCLSNQPLTARAI